MRLSLTSRLNAGFWLDGPRVNLYHVFSFEMAKRFGFILFLQAILQ